MLLFGIKPRCTIPIMSKLSTEATFGLGFEVLLAILDHLHVREPVLIWGLFVFGLVLICDSILRGEWAERITDQRKRRKRRALWMLVAIVVFLAFGFWVHGRLRIEPQSQKRPLTLEELFKTDFSSLNKWSYSAMFTDPSDGATIPMEEQMHIDYQAYSRFLSFYLPYSPHAYNACVWVAGHPNEILDQMDKNEVITRDPTQQHGISTKELKFSSRVYIYTLSDFTLSQQAALEAEYRRNGLALEIRGLTYMDVTNLERRN